MSLLFFHDFITGASILLDVAFLIFLTSFRAEKDKIHAIFVTLDSHHVSFYLPSSVIESAFILVHYDGIKSFIPVSHCLPCLCEQRNHISHGAFWREKISNGNDSKKPSDFCTITHKEVLEGKFYPVDQNLTVSRMGSHPYLLYNFLTLDEAASSEHMYSDIFFLSFFYLFESFLSSTCPLFLHISIMVEFFQLYNFFSSAILQGLHACLGGRQPFQTYNISRALSGK